MFRLTLLVAALAAALFIVSAQAATPRLTGETGPGFSIEVTKAGKDVKTLKAGKYMLKIEDKSSIHNFHLFGPGVNRKTSLPFTGETTWKLTLKPGKYTYQCDVHAAAGMKGSFRVTK
jgi:plastocyanin